MDGVVSETHVGAALCGVDAQDILGTARFKTLAFSCVVDLDNLRHKQDGGMWVEAYS